MSETPSSLREENKRLRIALHHISLASQKSMSSKEECGRIARSALYAEQRMQRMVSVPLLADTVIGLERERDEAREALRELVRIKDLHDKIEHEKRSQFFHSADELQAALDDYRTNKPLAWDRAQAIVARN